MIRLLFWHLIDSLMIALLPSLGLRTDLLVPPFFFGVPLHVEEADFLT